MQPESVVKDAGLAMKIGELLCEAHYRDLSRQRPLSVIDKGLYWRVEGNWNRGGVAEGPAEFFLSIDKSSGRAMDIGEIARYMPHPSLAPVISQQLARWNAEHRELAQSFGQMIESNEKVDPDKSGVGMLLLIQMTRGGVVFSADLAIKIGELLCESHYGDLTRQKPLSAEDNETFWRVEGSSTPEKSRAETGQFSFCIDKYDGKVTQLGEQSSSTVVRV